MKTPSLVAEYKANPADIARWFAVCVARSGSERTKRLRKKRSKEIERFVKLATARCAHQLGAEPESLP